MMLKGKGGSLPQTPWEPLTSITLETANQKAIKSSYFFLMALWQMRNGMGKFWWAR